MRFLVYTLPTLNFSEVVRMGYYVRRIKNNQTRTWRLQFVTEKDGVAKSEDVPADEMAHHQFHPSMTYEEAKEKQQLLNKELERKRWAEKRLKIKNRLETEAHEAALAFPDEAAFLKWKDQTQRFSNPKSSKFESNWHCAKKVVSELEIKPTEYADKARLIYRWFQDKQLSIAYLKRIIRLLNLYGTFHGKTYKVYVEKLPMPKGYDRSDIEDAYFEKHPDGNEAKPLTPGALDSAQSVLKPEAYAWLYLSVWAGLRPPEVDALHKEGTYRTEQQSGVTVLWVYQSKLRKISKDRRWKGIPLIEPEQPRVLEIIQSKAFKRPLLKTIANVFGEGHGTYSGRKGFTDLMLGRGHDLEDISSWLGHQDISMTWKVYKDRKKVHFKQKPLSQTQ